MITSAIPISILLIPYGLFLLVFLIFSLFHFYHVFRFAFGDIKVFAGTFIFIGAVALILFYSFQLLAPVDWSYPLINLGGAAGSIFFPK